MQLNTRKQHFTKHTTRHQNLREVQQLGAALSLAETSLQQDKQIVLTAIRKDGRNLRFAAKSLRNNIEFIREVVEIDVKVPAWKPTRIH